MRETVPSAVSFGSKPPTDVSKPLSEMRSTSANPEGTVGVFPVLGGGVGVVAGGVQVWVVAGLGVTTPAQSLVREHKRA